MDNAEEIIILDQDENKSAAGVPLSNYSFIKEEVAVYDVEEEEVVHSRIPVQALPVWRDHHHINENPLQLRVPQNMCNFSNPCLNCETCRHATCGYSGVDVKPPQYLEPFSRCHYVSPEASSLDGKLLRCFDDLASSVDVEEPPPPYTGPYDNLAELDPTYDPHLPSTSEGTSYSNFLCVECPKCHEKSFNLNDHIPYCRGVTIQKSKVKYTCITEKCEVKYSPVIPSSSVLTNEGLRQHLLHQGEEVIVQAIDDDSDDESVGNAMTHDECMFGGAAVQASDPDMEENNNSSLEVFPKEEQQPFGLLHQNNQFKIDSVFSLSSINVDSGNRENELLTGEEKMNYENSVKILDCEQKQYSSECYSKNELGEVTAPPEEKVDYEKLIQSLDYKPVCCSSHSNNENNLYAAMTPVEQKLNYEDSERAPDFEPKYFTYRRDTENVLPATAVTLGEDKMKSVNVPDSNPKFYACRLCSQLFLTRYHLKSHRLYVCIRKPFSCDVCWTKFASKGDLMSHKFSLKKCVLKKFECSKCQNRFVRKSGLNSHILLNVCGAKNGLGDCNDSSSLSLFRQSNHSHYHQKATFEGSLDVARGFIYCQFCFLACQDESDLEQHRTYHCSAKPHQCPNCGRRFLSRSKVLNHVFINCEVEEKMAETTKIIDASDVAASSHLSTPWVGSYTCSMCRQKPLTLSEYVMHLEIFCEKLPYQCRGCQKRFLTALSLQAHENRHFFLASINKYSDREGPEGCIGLPCLY